MPINDEPIKIRLDQLESDLDEDICLDLKQMTVAGALSLIPGIGSAIQSLLDGKAQRNVQRRWIQLFQDMKERIDEVRSSIPDDTYYSSEEFQTLLAQAYQQLLTTHDREKLKLLAAGLANSGTAEFKHDDNEQYLLILRDLTLRDLMTPNGKALQVTVPPEESATYDLPEMSRLSRLSGMGLLHERRFSGFGGTSEIGKDRNYWLSDLGQSFLRFISLENGAAS